jgi:hypothetical protein
MRASTGITPVIKPVFMPKSTSISGPSPSSLPDRPAGAKDGDIEGPHEAPHQRHHQTFALPKLRLEVRDLSHPGSRSFLSSVVPTTAFEFAVRRSLDLLYISPKCPTTTIPGTRSITLILRSMTGVAYTTGTELDDDHKEIHFSVEYINGIAASRKADEILGVLTHEVVHCYQYNARGTCPGGLIEGIADWVRLNSNLSPPHWKRETSGKWDAGYQHTGYFLDYLEKRYGDGTISRLNEKLRTDRYKEKPFWTELLGRPVEQLWSDYIEAVQAESALLQEPARDRADTEEDEEMVMVEMVDARNAEEAIPGTDPAGPTPTPATEPIGEITAADTKTNSTPAGVV